MPVPEAQDRINDFVVKLANVNGTGSASANTLLMKSIFRMGIPVIGKNYFPSNIQGLPTWYEIRVTRDSYVARSGRVDVMVAMNAETYAKDIKEVSPGGYLLYDSTWPRPALLKRDDITIFGVPLARMCNETFQGVRSRILLKNIMYAGVLAALFEIDLEIMRALLGESYGSKKSLLDSNVKALEMGFNYAKEHLPTPLPIRVSRMDKTSDSCPDRRQHGGGARLLVCRRNGRRVVSDHAIDLVDGRIQGLLPEVARRSANQRTQLRNRSGRRRAVGDRRGDRRFVERRAIVHTDERSWHLAHERIHRARVLRRNSRRDLRHPTRRTVDGHADSHSAM